MKYITPPIVEVVCEFRFIPSKPWDITVPGLLYEKIKKEFPNKEQKNVFDIGIERKVSGIEHKVESSQRMFFYSADRRALVQVGRDVLAVNHFKPYPTWNNLKPKILQNLERYRQVVEPKGFKRIGLRYINKLEFEKTKIKLSDYLNIYPQIPEELNEGQNIFTTRIEIPYENRRDLLRIILSRKILENQNTYSYFFDLDYFMDKSSKITIAGANKWIEDAHNKIENSFEACITDNCRTLFMKEK